MHVLLIGLSDINDDTTMTVSVRPASAQTARVRGECLSAHCELEAMSAQRSGTGTKSLIETETHLVAALDLLRFG